MDNFDASAYNICVVRREIDGHYYFVGTVREFPHIKVYEDSWAQAYQALLGIIEDLFVEANELNEAFPAPSSDDVNCSGSVTTHLPKWLHARLVSQAKSEDVNLHSHILTLLTLASTNRAYATTAAVGPLSKPGGQPEDPGPTPQASNVHTTPCA